MTSWFWNTCSISLFHHQSTNWNKKGRICDNILSKLSFEKKHSFFIVLRLTYTKKTFKRNIFFFNKVTLIAIRLRNFEPCFNWNKNVKVVGNKVFFNERRKRFVFSILFLENKWTEGLERNKRLTSITPVYLAPKGTFFAIFPVSLFSVIYDWSESYNSLFLSWSMILLPLNCLHCHLLFNCV